MMKERYDLKIISEFDDKNPYQSAILTQEMCNIINPIKNRLNPKTAVFAIFSQVPLSSYSKNKAKVIEYLKQVIPKDGLYSEFKNNSKGKEIEMELIFFLAEDYEKRDVDNFIKIITDSLIGIWYEDDGQIKKIIAEKQKVTNMEIGINPKLYEQIYCSVKIL